MVSFFSSGMAVGIFNASLRGSRCAKILSSGNLTSNARNKRRPERMPGAGAFLGAFVRVVQMDGRPGLCPARDGAADSGELCAGEDQCRSISGHCEKIRRGTASRPT